MAASREISEEEVNRLIDGQLTPGERADLQSRLALHPELAARVFADMRGMEAVRALQPHRSGPPRASVEAARRLESVLHRGKTWTGVRIAAAAALLLALGWGANSLTEHWRESTYTVDRDFILAAREALRIAQFDTRLERSSESARSQFGRLEAGTNIDLPELPSTWQVTNIDVQPWENKRSVVLTATTPDLGEVTLIAAPLDGENIVPPTLTDDGRMPAVYWQVGMTAYALVGTAAPERLKREADGLDVAGDAMEASNPQG